MEIDTMNENLTPNDEEIMPSSTPILVDNSIKSTSGILDFTAGFSTMKYGLVSFLAQFPAIILMVVVAFVISLFQGINGILDILTIIIILLFGVTASIQILSYPVSMALADGNSNIDRMGYIQSWRTAGLMTIETLSVSGGIMVVLGIGTFMAMDGSTVGIVLATVSGIAFVLFILGLIPYVVRKIASEMN